MAGSLISNCTCKIYLRTVSYKGEVTDTLEHTIDGWLEEGSVMSIGKISSGSPTAGLLMGSAELFLWDDVELEGRIVKIDSTSYEIMSWHRRVEPDDNIFSHLELILR